MSNSPTRADGFGGPDYRESREFKRQRVAIARALANRPEIIVADEPTDALDTASTEQVLSILRDIADKGQTVVVVTPRSSTGCPRRAPHPHRRRQDRRDHQTGRQRAGVRNGKLTGE